MGDDLAAASNPVPDLSALQPDEKRAMLRELLRREQPPRRDAAASVSPAAGSKHEPFPLTEIQQAYWLGRGDGFPLGGVGIHGYFEIDCVDVDLPRLNRAWQRTVERHDMMRAVVLPDGTQRILESVPHYEFEVRDLRDAGFRELRAWLSATRRRMSHQVFDPETWPLFEIRATKLPGGRTRLHFGEDAIHVDLRSTAIILGDWLDLYADPDVELPPLELSYRDYVLALREREATPGYREAERYWRKRAEELCPAPDLPLVEGVEALRSPRFRRRRGRVGAGAWQALQDQAARAGLTPSSLLMAAYGEVIGAWSQAERFSLNATVFNRLPVHPDVEHIAGDFTSMLFVDVDRSADLAFVDRALAMQRSLWADLEHRDVSGIEVLRDITRGESGDGLAMMPVVYTSALGTAGYRAFRRLGRVVYGVTQTPQVLIDQQVFEEDGELIVFWDAVDRAFPPGVLDAMHGAYIDLLERLAADPDLWRRGRIDLLPAGQRRRRRELNRTAEAVRPALLHEIFRDRAAAAPDRPAVIAGGATLSYSELDALSDRLAGRLQPLGARPDTLVAVVMEKGWEQVVAVLAILKAGAAFVPVDPELPARRFRDLLARSEAEVALTQPHVADRVDWPETVTPVEVTRELEGMPGDGPVTGSPSVAPENLAYVLYTSGSTGRPKGVMIEHRSVVNRMPEVLRRFEIGESDRAIAVTALQHDLAIFDLFGILLGGGCLVVPEAARSRDAAHWSELIDRHGVTVWNSVPAFLDLLVGHVEREAKERSAPSPLTSLRRVLLSGDWIPVPLPDRLRTLAPGAEVISLGGPTETTVWDICYPIGEVDPNWDSVPYGRPMRNARYHVLKGGLEPCPDWVAGELCIAGEGLARGYWRDPELTERSFIHLPESGERVFRSGDLGRLKPDGNIEILGRMDRQIKLNGQRIELSEVEASLNEHPEVERVVAAAVRDGEGPRRLVAWAVPVPGLRPETGGTTSKRDWGLPGGESALEALDRRRARAEARRQAGARLELAPVPGPPEAFEKRRTCRVFAPETVPAAALSSLLGRLGPAPGPAALARYRYPSAGGLYPVLTYVYVAPGRVEGCDGGFHWYDPEEHTLVALSDAVLDPRCHHPRNREIFRDSALSLFFVADLAIIEPSYGDEALQLCTLEAGYLSQLLMEEAGSVGLGLCPIGGLDLSDVAGELRLEPEQRVVHSMCCGVPGTAPERSGGAPPGGEATARRAFDRALEASLRAHALERLPASWVPGTFTVVDALPLNANGKVDVRRLPTPDAQRPEYAAPESELEERVARVWAERLGTEIVGRHDNFFDLGASSMELIEVFNTLRSETGAAASLVDFFRYPTVAELAAFLDGRQESRAREEGVGRARLRAEARAARRRHRGSASEDE